MSRDRMRKDTNRLTHFVCLFVLMLFTWFSSQAPVTPRLSALVAKEIPASRASTGSPVAEDLTNGSLYEHLSEVRRRDQNHGLAERARVFHHIPTDALLHGRSLESAALAQPSGRALLSHHCILRT